MKNEEEYNILKDEGGSTSLEAVMAFTMLTALLSSYMMYATSLMDSVQYNNRRSQVRLVGSRLALALDTYAYTYSGTAYYINQDDMSKYLGKDNSNIRFDVKTRTREERDVISLNLIKQEGDFGQAEDMIPTPVSIYPILDNFTVKMQRGGQILVNPEFIKYNRAYNTLSIQNYSTSDRWW